MAPNVLKTVLALKTKGGKAVEQQLDAIGNKTKKLASDIQKQEDIRKKTFEIFQTDQRKQQALQDANIKKQEKLAQATKAMQGRMLGMGFSALFGGMAIKNFFQNIARGLFNTFSLAHTETSYFHQATSRLSGAWEYLKFSIVDALMSSGLLTMFIDGMIWFIDLLTRMPDVVKVGFMVLILMMVAIGAVLMTLGQIIMLTIGIMTLFGIGAFAAGLILLGIVLTIIILTAAIVALAAIWTSDMSKTEKVLWTIVVVIAAIILILIAFGVVAAMPFIIIGGAIAIVIGAFALLVGRLGGVKEAFQAIGIFILRILAFIADAIFEALISPIKMFLLLVNAAIAGMHKLGFGKSISQIEMPDTFGAGLGAKVDVMRDTLLAEADQKRMDERAAQMEAEMNGTTEVKEGNKFSIQNMNVSLPNGMKLEDFMKQVEDMQMQTTGSPSAE